jgi:hypothetical protein
MFGTLKPARAAFDCGTRGEWQRFYCGTCQSLGDQFGLGYRGLLSHDAVFLGFLVDGLQDHAAPPDRTRCPMVPVVHRPTISPSSVAMRYAGAVQLLLADQWLADRAIDGRSFARIARPLIAKPAERARATLAELGSDLAELIGIEDRQAAAELPGTTDPEQAAEPTAGALALVFERIAGLPGWVADATTRAVLARLGRAVGTAIYLVDALEDLERDHRAGDFNPCLIHDYRGRAQISAGRVRRASALLTDAGEQIREALAALPLRRHAKVLDNILVTQLGARAKLAIAGAERLLAQIGHPLGRRRRLLASEHRGVVRFAQALVALAVVFVSGLWSRIVRATSESDSGTDTDTGGETGGEAAPTDVMSGTETGVDVDADASGIPCPCFSWIGELISGCCGGLTDACGELNESCGACGSCMNGCTNSCGSCGQSCGEGCSTCNGDCGDCGSVCSGCGNCCKSSDECGYCCNSCSGCNQCGNACSGCGECGNACSGCGECGKGCNDCGNCGGGGCNC